MTRTNSWMSRRRRRRRQASQARTLARWTGSCGNILPRPGGACSPLAQPSHSPHPGPAPQADSPVFLAPAPLCSVSQLPSDLAPLGQVSSVRVSPVPSDPPPHLSRSWTLVGRPACSAPGACGRAGGPSFSLLPPQLLRLSLPRTLHHSILPLQEMGSYSGFTGGRGRGEPPLSN